MHGGAGVWYHQSDTGIPSILTAGFGKRQRRVESGLDGVEFEANVCIGRVIDCRRGDIYYSNGHF